ncbi:MAG: HEPN domain-containing protein [Gemmatimonadota bacterium]
MSTSIVAQLHDDFLALTSVIDASVEPSLAITANDVFRKSLLLAAASEFELAITSVITAFAETEAGGSSPLVAFVRSKALARQYHTLFKWDAANANQFFGLFGDEFKRHANAAIGADAALKDAIASFLQLGDERNRLVHQGFGTFVLEKTADEIFAAYARASLFVARLPDLLATCPR